MTITTKAQVMTLLKDNSDARGMEHWKRQPSDLRSFGIGLTRLRKIAKSIGRNHRLAKSLWSSDVYDAKVLSLLMDDPNQMTPEQAESQVESGLADGMLSHVFASCDATLAKTSFAAELCVRWMDHSDPMRRRCGYGLLYELSKKPKAFDDGFWTQRIAIIEANIHGEEMWVREAMSAALMGIGKRSALLNQAAIRAARAIGPVDVDYGPDNRCEPLDILKHLQADHLQAKLQRQR